MLAAANRLRTRTDFSDVVRRGRRASRPLLTVHLLAAELLSEPDSLPLPPRAGLVVSKAVGGSVVRHQVARRLRHVLRPALSALPPGARVVVRATPAAATANSAALAADLAAALDRLVRR